MFFLRHSVQLSSGYRVPVFFLSRFSKGFSKSLLFILKHCIHQTNTFFVCVNCKSLTFAASSGFALFTRKISVCSPVVGNIDECVGDEGAGK